VTKGGYILDADISIYTLDYTSWKESIMAGKPLREIFRIVINNIWVSFKNVIIVSDNINADRMVRLILV